MTTPAAPALAAHVYPAGASWAWYVALRTPSLAPRVAAGFGCASESLARSAAGAALAEARALYAEWWAEAPAPMLLRERRA